MNGRGHVITNRGKNDSAEQVNRSGLALDMIPGRQIIGAYPNEFLSKNLLPNGNFNDFTLEDVEEANANIAPNLLTINTGAIIDGAIEDVESDDGDYLILSEVVGAPGFSYEFTFTLLPNLVGQNLHFVGRYEGNPAHVVKIQAWNGSVWDDVGILNTSVIDQDAEINIENVHTQNGVVSLRVYHAQSGNPNHRLLIDLMHIHTHRYATTAHFVFDDVFHKEEKTGLAINQDLSGHNNDLTPSGFGSDFENELKAGSLIYRNGNGLEFNGTDQYLGCGSDNFDVGADDFTIIANIKTPEVVATAIKVIASKREGFSSSQGGWILSTYRQSVYFSYSNGSSSFNLITGELTGNTHYQIIITGNRSTGVLTAYLNGIVENSIPAFTIADSSFDLFIGCMQNLSYWFNSMIYEFSFYKGKAFTAQEANSAYCCPKYFSASGSSGTFEKIGFAVRINNEGGRFEFPNVDFNTDRLHKLTLKKLDQINDIELDLKLTGLTTLPAVSGSHNLYFNQSLAADPINLVALNAGDALLLTGAAIKEVTNANKMPNQIVHNYATDNLKGAVREFDDFETTINHWIGNVYIVARSTDDAYDGNYSLKTVATGVAGATLNASQRGISGALYKVSFWFKSDLVGEYTISLWQEYNTFTVFQAGVWEFKEVEISGAFGSSYSGYYPVSQLAHTSYMDDYKVELVPDYKHGETHNGLSVNNLQHPFALDYDGLDDLIDFDDNFNLGTSDVIIQGWLNVKVDGITNILNKWALNAQYQLRLNSTNHLRFTAEDGTNTAAINGGTALLKDRWLNYAIVWDRNVGCSLWINGVVDAEENTAEWTNIGAITNTNPFRIGRLAASYMLSKHGRLSIYLFDGQDGRPTQLPSDPGTSIIKFNYDLQKRFYTDL